MAQSPYVAVDVGGREFKIMRNTVMKYPNCTLVKVITGVDPTSALLEGGTYFFDRNPDYFSVLVDYMRTGKVFLSPTLNQEQFTIEAEFWGLLEATGTAPPKPETTVVLQQPIGPTLVLDTTEFAAPAKTQTNGYSVSFGPNSMPMKHASSEGSLASSVVSPAGADPLLGNFIGGLELKTSIEAAGSMKRKQGELDHTEPLKRAKMIPRKLPSIEEVKAELVRMNTLQSARTPPPSFQVTAILSSFELSERNSISDKIRRLNGRIVETFDEKPTHLILTEFKNTKKLLVAINKGLEIVSSRWVYESVKAGEWLPAGEYYACTKEDERKHRFVYAETLKKARNGGFLTNYTFYISPSVRPSPRDFEEVVTSAGGKTLTKRPAAVMPGLFVVTEGKSQEADELRKQGFEVRDSEWLCGCVFQQTVG